MKPAILNGISAILFDVYGTLVDIPRPTRPYRQLLALARAQGAPLADHAGKEMMTTRMTLSQAALWLGVSVPMRQMQDLEQELAEELDSARIFPEVPEILKVLRDRGYRLALCSNLAAPYVEPAQRLLRAHIEIEIWSCDVGKVKPDPEIYRLAVERIGVPASEVLMIGDTYRADVAGPQAAGMRAKLLDRRGRSGVTENSWRTLDMLVLAV